MVFKWLAILVAVALCGPVEVWASPFFAAQAQSTEPALGADHGSHDPMQRAEDEAREKMQRDMAKKANKQRQDQLKKDTEQLLKLANELKEYVDKSNENILSIDVVKKAEEIEKLAHSVKEKMKNSY